MDRGRPIFLLRAIWIELLDAILPPHARTVRTKARGFDESCARRLAAWLAQT